MRRTCRTLLPTLMLSLILIPLSVSGEAIYDIQYTTDPSGNSPYNGQVVTINGVVTSINYDGYVIAEAPGAWHGIYVYSWRDGPHNG